MEHFMHDAIERADSEIVNGLSDEQIPAELLRDPLQPQVYPQHGHRNPAN